MGHGKWVDSAFWPRERVLSEWTRHMCITANSFRTLQQIDTVPLASSQWAFFCFPVPLRALYGFGSGPHRPLQGPRSFDPTLLGKCGHRFRWDAYLQTRPITSASPGPGAWQAGGIWRRLPCMKHVRASQTRSFSFFSLNPRRARVISGKGFSDGAEWLGGTPSCDLSATQHPISLRSSCPAKNTPKCRLPRSAALRYPVLLGAARRSLTM